MAVRIGVVMPVLSQWEMAVKALDSITTRHRWQLYLIAQWRLHWPLAKAWNEGIARAIAEGCSHILVLNDDLLLSPHTIDVLVEKLDADERRALVSGCNIRSEISPEQLAAFPAPPNPSDAPHPDFACFMLTARSYERIGPFDERFAPAYFEDNDYHYRIGLAGLEAIASGAAPYYHYGSSTQNGAGAPVVSGREFEDNRAYYVSKWGGVPGAEAYLQPFGA